jgi:hypothetical protein
MAEQSRQPDQEPNHASSMEKAEGSRDTAEANRSSHDAGGQQHGAGITNRPLEEEREEQDSLPPRGTAKDGSHA